MKVLGIHSALSSEPDRQSQVDHWRIHRPLRELAKHVDWRIEHASGFVPNRKENYDKPEFTESEIQEAYNNLKDYDIVFSSYHPDPTAYTLMQVLRDREGVQFVMDVDDDMFSINPDNPFWLKSNHENVYHMQRMIANNAWITTPSEVLAKRFRERRPGLPADSVTVIPNFISDDFAHPEFDNGDKVVIGYCGGSSHYFDLHDSGVLAAIQKLMHEDKRVHFKLVGMFSDVYTPKARTEFSLGVRGDRFMSELYPTLNFDIAIGPLNDNIFNWGKSNIKWQESTRGHAAFIASNIGPYADLKHRENALLVSHNTAGEWYDALKLLVDNVAMRKKIVDQATKDVTMNWKLEYNWHHYEQLFKRVKKEGTSADHRTIVGLSAGKAAR